MTTYSETQGKQPFNWYEALNQDKPDWKMLKKLAGKWVTCACGNQCDVIPRNEYGMPKDVELRKVGGIFYTQIYCRNAEEALSILNKIEIRSSEIIDEIKKGEK